MQEDIRLIYAKNMRLTPEAYEYIEKNEMEHGALDLILSSESPIITREMIDEFRSASSKVPVQATVSRSPSFRPVAAEHRPKFRLLSGSENNGQTRCTGKLEDFVSHFNDRFERISSILRKRISQHPVVTTKKLQDSQGSKVRLIAMVTDKRSTKKGNLLIDVEDQEGTAKVVIPKDTEGFKAAQRMLLDDIVAFDGKNAEALFIADVVTWPEVPVAREQKRTEDDIAIAYISDLHLGNKKFLEKEFARFISWLNGAEGRRELAGKVKYLMVCGDIVDGIGIYPDQERELAVKDIYKQYEMFDRVAEKIPDHITVIVAPGNHDAVRRAEPQPQIPHDLMKADVVRVGNPASIDIEGLRHLMYHGTSLDSIIAGMSGLSYSRPEEAMLEILRRRHLSPIYGDNLIVPESHDAMVIGEEPDVLHMGHVHKNGYMTYRGTLILNSGTFQDRTDYQVRVGHVPSPGVVPVLETATGKLNHISFMGEPLA